MVADIHLDEKDGFNDLNLNSILRYTGAYEGNSTVSVQLLQIPTDLNESK